MTFFFDKLATVSGHALSVTEIVLSAVWAAAVDANKTDAVDQALEIAGDALYLADIAGDTLDLVDDVTKLFSLVGIGIGLLFALSRWVLPSWRILRRCLFYGQPFSRLRAAGEVFLCFYYLWWETRDLYRAARLRVEAELLQPRPEQPFPSFESKEDWHSAIKEYRKKNNEWRYNLKRLLANLADQSSSGKSPVVCLGRWFDLAEDTTVTRIKRYFQVLASERSPQATSVDSFLTSIQITSGFIAPIHLVAGLLLRFQQDWGRIIDAYGYAASRDRDPLQRRTQVLKLRAFQTFLFDCWLLWGPSIPICTCEYWRGVIAMQYGFGDENNSFPLIDTAGTLTERYRKLLAPYEEPRPVAVPASIDVRIRSGSALAASAPIAHAQRNIKDTLVLELTELHEVSGDQIRIAGTYYSAYIWVMFVVQRSDGQPLFPEQKWRGLLPFFEHGNIADGSIYNFLKRQLARKTLAAIEQILGQEADLKLGYVSAFDEPASCGKDLRFPLSGLRIREIMEELLANEFPHLQSLGRLSLAKGTDPEYSACHLPDIIEAFYADLENYPKAPPRKTMYKYAELSSVPEDRALLQQFYHGLYKGEFPDPNERESLSNIWRYLELKSEKWYGRNNYHVILALDGDEVVGGSISDYLAEPNAGVIEFLVVAPSRRKQGIGARLLEHTEKVLVADAEAVSSAGLDVIVAEMDDPYKIGFSQDALDPFVRARLWHQWGYQRIDFPYVQPALSAKQQPVHHLFLVAKALQFENRTSISAESLKTIVHEYMRWAMRIKKPDRELEYIKMARYLSERTRVDLIPLSCLIGWDDARPLHVSEIVNDSGPELAAVLRIYQNVFSPGPVTANADAFKQALRSPPSRSSRFHLWALRASPAHPVSGMASFFSFPSAGFGGYLALGEGLRGTGRLRPLLARIEEQMLRDFVDARGWYIECATQETADLFAQMGFFEVALTYRHPPFAPESDAPLDQAPVVQLLYKEFGRHFREPLLVRADFHSAMHAIFRVVYQIEDPAMSPWLQEIVRQTAAWPEGILQFHRRDQAL